MMHVARLRVAAASHDDAARAHDRHRGEIAAGFPILVAMGQDLLKAVSLLNGGAAAATIALLAVMFREAGARWLVAPLSLFGFGLAAAAFATGWSYLAQARHAESRARCAFAAEPPFVVETDASRVAAAAARRFQRLAFGTVLVAMASAILGFWAAAAILLLRLG